MAEFKPTLQEIDIISGPQSSKDLFDSQLQKTQDNADFQCIITIINNSQEAISDQEIFSIRTGAQYILAQNYHIESQSEQSPQDKSRDSRNSNEVLNKVLCQSNFSSNEIKIVLESFKQQETYLLLNNSLDQSNLKKDLSDLKDILSNGQEQASSQQVFQEQKINEKVEKCKRLANYKRGSQQNRKAQAIERDIKQKKSHKICKPKLRKDKYENSWLPQHLSTQSPINQESHIFQYSQLSYFPSDFQREKMNQEEKSNSQGQSQIKNFLRSNKIKQIENEGINQQKTQQEGEHKDLRVGGKKRAPAIKKQKQILEKPKTKKTKKDKNETTSSRISKNNQSLFYQIYKQRNGNPSKNNVEFQFKRLLKNITTVKGRDFVQNHPVIKEIKDSIKKRKNKNPTKQNLQKLILIQGINQEQAIRIVDIINLGNLVYVNPSDKMLRYIFRNFYLRGRISRARAAGKLDKMVDFQANEQMKLLHLQLSTRRRINRSRLAKRIKLGKDSIISINSQNELGQSHGLERPQGLIASQGLESAQRSEEPQEHETSMMIQGEKSLRFYGSQESSWFYCQTSKQNSQDI